MKGNINKGNLPVEIFEGSLVMLHKVLKGEDVYKAERLANQRGDNQVCNPPIVIDFKYVTSIQMDYKDGGTVIMDAKTACIVTEPLEEVLDAWCEVKRNLEQTEQL